jgi:hypothetical protein
MGLPIVEPDELQFSGAVLQANSEKPGFTGKEAHLSAVENLASDQGGLSVPAIADRANGCAVLVSKGHEEKEVEKGVNVFSGKVTRPFRAHTVESGDGKGERLDLFEIAGFPEAQHSSFQP